MLPQAKCRASLRPHAALGIHPISRDYTVCSFSIIKKMRIAMNQLPNIFMLVGRIWGLLLAAIIVVGCGTAPAPVAAPTSAPVATSVIAAPTSALVATSARAELAPTSAPASKPQPVPLTFAFPDDAASSAAALAQIAAYTSEHPDVQVTAKPLPAADYARQLLDSVGTSTTDLFVSTDGLMPALLNRKAVLDL